MPTTAIQLKSNLRADAELVAGGASIGTTFDTAYATSNFTTSIKVFDSLGAKHTLNLFFTRTGANAWDLQRRRRRRRHRRHARRSDRSSAAAPSASIPTARSPPIPSTPSVDVTFSGAAAQTITLGFGTPNPDPIANPGEGIDGVTQFAGPSAVGFQSQNGFGAGQLLSLEFNEAGVVTGVFDNGQTRPLFQLALANFVAPDGLTPLGNGLYRESVDSGSPAIGTPQAGGLGSIVAGAVELSNVDHRAGVHRPDLDPAQLPGQRARHHLQRHAPERPDQHRPIGM